MSYTYDRENLIPFTDDFIFGMVMQSEEVCSGILNMILPDGGFDKIRLRPQQNPFFAENPETFSVEIQKSVKFEKDLRGVRFDAYATTYNKAADVEMLTYREPFLGKRARFYHGNMVLDQSAPGMSYGEIRAGYVIFICTYDPFNLDEPIYFFQKYDKNLQLSLNDEEYTIILHTGCSPEKVPEHLRAFYAYINDPGRQESELVKKIDDRVKKFNSAEWRHRRMTFGYYLDRKLEEGREIGFRLGRAEGLAEGHAEGRAEGHAEGRAEGLAEGQEQMAQLVSLLLKANRIDDLKRAAEDIEYKQNLLEEFQLI